MNVLPFIWVATIMLALATVAWNPRGFLNQLFKMIYLLGTLYGCAILWEFYKTADAVITITQ